ncbi:MAG: hypothetical protein IPH21_14365 [Flavobacteriales bacterium]|nr:hypothetical protein [Flavobacteriales bacterium]
MKGEKAFIVYAWRYRKGKKIDLIETTLLGLFHMRQSKSEDEEIVLIHGFGRWWHVNVRLNWNSLKSWVSAWTLQRTFWMVGTFVGLTTLWTFIETRKWSPEKEEYTTGTVDTLATDKQLPVLSKSQTICDSLSVDKAVKEKEKKHYP